MFKKWRKKQEKSQQNENNLEWDKPAKDALEQAVAQPPVPSMLKNKVRSELTTAAENITRAAGRTLVTAEDLMQGFMSKLPENMRTKIESAAQKGPEGLKELEKELRKKK